MHLELANSTAGGPWILQNPPRKWFLMLLLKCWNNSVNIILDQSGMTRAYQTLSEYYQSSYDGFGSLQQVLLYICMNILRILLI